MGTHRSRSAGMGPVAYGGDISRAVVSCFCRAWFSFCEYVQSQGWACWNTRGTAGFDRQWWESVQGCVTAVSSIHQHGLRADESGLVTRQGLCSTMQGLLVSIEGRIKVLP